MKKTGFLYDPRYLLHETGPYHPEVPERLQAIPDAKYCIRCQELVERSPARLF